MCLTHKKPKTRVLFVSYKIHLARKPKKAFFPPRRALKISRLIKPIPYSEGFENKQKRNIRYENRGTLYLVCSLKTQEATSNVEVQNGRKIS